MKITVNGIERKNVAGFDHNETKVFLTFKNGKKKTFSSKKGWNMILIEYFDNNKTRKSRTIQFIKK